MPPGPLPALQLSRCDPFTIPRYLAGPHFVVGPPPSPHVADAPPPPYFDAPQWDVGLELHYQLFDRSVWVILACDDVLDRIAWERVDAVLASADTQWRSLQQEEEYVERWRLLGQRRIERWQRLLALHCAREAFLAVQRRIRPSLSECELSATIPPANAAFDKAPCAPIQSVWPLPVRPKRRYKSPPLFASAHLPGFDPAPYVVADTRVLASPPPFAVLSPEARTVSQTPHSETRLIHRGEHLRERGLRNEAAATGVLLDGVSCNAGSGHDIEQRAVL